MKILYLRFVHVFETEMLPRLIENMLWNSLVETLGSIVPVTMQSSLHIKDEEKARQEATQLTRLQCAREVSPIHYSPDGIYALVGWWSIWSGHIHQDDIALQTWMHTGMTKMAFSFDIKMGWSQDYVGLKCMSIVYKRWNCATKDCLQYMWCCHDISWSKPWCSWRSWHEMRWENMNVMVMVSAKVTMLMA